MDFNPMSERERMDSHAEQYTWSLRPRKVFVVMPIYSLPKPDHKIRVFSTQAAALRATREVGGVYIELPLETTWTCPTCHQEVPA